eukprot:1159670-Pelagomonas_calceolata.AAC.11
MGCFPTGHSHHHGTLQGNWYGGHMVLATSNGLLPVKQTQRKSRGLHPLLQVKQLRRLHSSSTAAQT